MSDNGTVGSGAASLFARAVELHKQGKDEEALFECEAALAMRSDDPDLWQLAGVLRSRRGWNDAALVAFQRAISLAPTNPMLHIQHALTLVVVGRRPEAEAALDRALQCDPRHVEALRLRARLRRERGDLDGAIAALERLLRAAPDDTESWTMLGACRTQRHEFGHAEACYRKAALSAPESASVHVAHSGALRNVGDYEAALAAAERACALAPDDPSAHDARAASLRYLGRTREGLAATERALAIDPEHAGALLHAGLLLHDAGNPDAAVGAYRRALARDPDNVDAHWNCGAALLTLGRFREGFAEYEWRLKSPLFYGRKQKHSQPRWDGSDRADRVLLIHPEQGLGDTIQFLRYVPLAARRGPVILEVQPPLRRLVVESGLTDAVVGTGEDLPPFDLRASLMSLPHLLDAYPGDAALPMPYLRADPRRIDRWLRRLDRLPWPRIGLCWRGNAQNPRDAIRSIPLATLSPLFEQPVSFVSLQQADAAPEIAAAELGFAIEDWSDEIDADGAFLDTAALIMALDLVVTVDTAVAHLAGALGRPALLMLAAQPDFRWMLGRGDTPWYPSLTLLRQRRPGDWSGPIADVQQALWRLVADG